MTARGIYTGAAIALATALALGGAGAAAVEGLVVREVESVPHAAAGESRPDLVPHGRVARGTRDIAAAWLAGPTTRYGHGVLGDGIEASRLAVETRDGRTLAFELPVSSVFEDLEPRLADLDGDGGDEVLVVESDVERGASLAVFRVTEGRIARVARTPFLGRANRWLNPVGAGDFDGDGALDIALVATPHIGGILRLYRVEPPALSLFAETRGVSTHRIGSTALGLGRVVPGADRDRLLLPDQSHRALRLLEWAPEGIREVDRVALASAIASSLVPAGERAWRFRLRGGGSREVRVELPDVHRAPRQPRRAPDAAT